MPSSSHLLPCLGLILLLLNSCESLDSPDSPSNPPTPQTTTETNQLNDNIYQWINAYRAKEQLHPLQRKKSLDRLAHKHTRQIAQDPGIERGHLNNSLRVHAIKIHHCEIDPLYYQGRLPQGDEQALPLIQQWSQSTHTNIVLTSKWKQIGIGSSKNAQGEDIVIVIVANPLPLGSNYLNSATLR